ncbi:MAG TPA: hypothetical protein PLZ00_01410, partial [Mangrovimonas sp.]|nr:hypothetical protein [Mangrovimonas sp.]
PVQTALKLARDRIQQKIGFLKNQKTILYVNIVVQKAIKIQGNWLNLHQEVQIPIAEAEDN